MSQDVAVTDDAANVLTLRYDVVGYIPLSPNTLVVFNVPTTKNIMKMSGHMSGSILPAAAV